MNLYEITIEWEEDVNGTMVPKKVTRAVTASDHDNLIQFAKDEFEDKNPNTPFSITYTRLLYENIIVGT